MTVDWRNLPPVSEDEQPEVPERPSQTFLKHHDRCDRAAMLYLKFRAGAGSHELNRGAIVHDVIARLTQRLIERGESSVSIEDGKDELLAYMDENPHLQVNALERDAARYMIANWAAGSWFDPNRILAVETTLTMEIGGFTVTGRVDLAEDVGLQTVQVTDYKTSFDMGDGDDFKAQAFDDEGNPYFAGNFQTMTYALLMAFGVMDDGLPLGESYERFRLVLRFPRYLRAEGLAQREVVVTRQQLVDFRLDVESQLRRLREVNIAQRKWQPTPGTHCRECPAEYACPLPKLLRPESQHADLDSIEDLEKAGTSWFFMSKRATNLKARLKKAAKRLGEEDPGALRLPSGDVGVLIGTDLALVFIPTEGEKMKPGGGAKLREAIEASTELGRPFRWEDHFTYSHGTKFDKRRVDPRPRKESTDGD